MGVGAAFIKWSWNPSPTIDQLGHGTAVSSAAAGGSIGVAKQATIHSVRIDDGERGAFSSDIIAGIDWVAGHYISPAIINLSYTHVQDEGIAAAVSGAIAAGITFVTLAGNNDGADACDPTTRVPGVITVAATSVADYRASYSNVGPCVDIFAPGGDFGGYANGNGLLELASNGGNSAYVFDAGTSFASPAVAGVAALILEQNRTLSPSAVKAAILDQSTQDAVLNPGVGSPNRLLFSRVIVPAPPSPPPVSPSIQGPSSVRPGSTCTWIATNGSAPTPATYTWYVDDVEQAELNQALEYFAGSNSFIIDLVLTDANGVRWTSRRLVSISSGAPTCLV